MSHAIIQFKVQVVWYLKNPCHNILDVLVSLCKTMKLTKLISNVEISKKVSCLAREIRKDYKDRKPLMIGCLTGGFVFMADLIREIAIPLECDFMKLSSYQNRMDAGKIKLLLDNTISVRGRDVIVVEDIVDTGESLKFIRRRLLKKKPKSLVVCALLYKESTRSTFPKDKIDYLGFVIPDKFVVGYGIDYAQCYRELSYIGVVKKI